MSKEAAAFSSGVLDGFDDYADDRLDGSLAIVSDDIAGMKLPKAPDQGFWHIGLKGAVGVALAGLLLVYMTRVGLRKYFRRKPLRHE
jgi:hypothetical protein